MGRAGNRRGNPGPGPRPDPTSEVVGLLLDPDLLHLELGESVELEVKPLPPNVPIPAKRLWTSENDQVARVSSSGRVEAVGNGLTRVLAFVRGAGLNAVSGTTAVVVGVPASGDLTSQAPPGRGFTILGLGDLPTPLTDSGADTLARVRTLRRELVDSGRDVLVIQTGDLGWSSSAEPWGAAALTSTLEVMSVLDGDREAPDPKLILALPSRFVRRMAEQSRPRGVGFGWLNALSADPRHASVETLEVGDWRVGLFNLAELRLGLDERLEFARRAIRELRGRGSRVVIGVTGKRLEDDVALARRLGTEDRVDVLFAGGEGAAGAILEPSTGTWVLRAESDARRVVVADIRARDDGEVTTSPRLVEISEEGLEPDPQVLSLSRRFAAEADAEACQATLDAPPGCFEKVLARTAVPLDASAATLRRFETTLGNWVADQMREAFRDDGEPRVQVAFLNAGALRLERRLPAGSEITGRTLVELTPFGNRLVLLRLDGRTLASVVRHARSQAASGGWLQVSGFAFRGGEGAPRVTLLDPQSGSTRPVRPEEKILAVTVEYLAQGGDGYTMLQEAERVAEGSVLRHRLAEVLMESAQDLAPKVEGRICDPRLPGPCLAR